MKTSTWTYLMRSSMKKTLCNCQLDSMNLRNNDTTCIPFFNAIRGCIFTQINFIMYLVMMKQHLKLIKIEPSLCFSVSRDGHFMVKPKNMLHFFRCQITGLKNNSTTIPSFEINRGRNLEQ